MAKAKRYAILSDIHSNIEALDAVIEDAQKRFVDKFLCLGDIVGYNAAPRECIRRIRDLNCVVVKGNHDLYCSDYRVDLTDFTDNAASVIEWTRRTITEEETQWLRSLPLTKPFLGLMLVHSTMDNPASFRYAFKESDVKDNFVNQGAHVCFHGHTHVPRIFVKRNSGGEGVAGIKSLDPIDMKLDETPHYFINVGSVGQPRDGIPKACYVICTVEGFKNITVEFRRVDYDIETAIQRIRNAGLPERLITRLETGL